MKFFVVRSLLCLLILNPNLGWGQSTELQALYDQFDQLYEEEKYREATSILEEMFALSEIEFGTDSVEHSKSFHRHALLFEKNGPFEQALDIVTILNGFALGLEDQRRYVEAEPLY